jgi:hypothetical protein
MAGEPTAEPREAGRNPRSWCVPRPQVKAIPARRAVHSARHVSSAPRMVLNEARAERKAPNAGRPAVAHVRRRATERWATLCAASAK